MGHLGYLLHCPGGSRLVCRPPPQLFLVPAVRSYPTRLGGFITWGGMTRPGLHGRNWASRQLMSKKQSKWHNGRRSREVTSGLKRHRCGRKEFVAEPPLVYSYRLCNKRLASTVSFTLVAIEFHFIYILTIPPSTPPCSSLRPDCRVLRHPLLRQESQV